MEKFNSQKFLNGCEKALEPIIGHCAAQISRDWGNGVYSLIVISDIFKDEVKFKNLMVRSDFLIEPIKKVIKEQNLGILVGVVGMTQEEFKDVRMVNSLKGYPI